jgi:hypothetical protein
MSVDDISSDKRQHHSIYFPRPRYLNYYIKIPNIQLQKIEAAGF